MITAPFISRLNDNRSMVCVFCWHGETSKHVVMEADPKRETAVGNIALLKAIRKLFKCYVHQRKHALESAKVYDDSRHQFIQDLQRVAKDIDDMQLREMCQAILSVMNQVLMLLPPATSRQAYWREDMVQLIEFIQQMKFKTVNKQSA